jgi:hypothetical protein
LKTCERDIADTRKQKDGMSDENTEIKTEWKDKVNCRNEVEKVPSYCWRISFQLYKPLCSCHIFHTHDSGPWNVVLYEGESNENRKTEIKIRNIAPLSYKLADMLPML